MNINYIHAPNNRTQFLLLLVWLTMQKSYFHKFKRMKWRCGYSAAYGIAVGTVDYWQENKIQQTFVYVSHMDHNGMNDRHFPTLRPKSHE